MLKLLRPLKTNSNNTAGSDTPISSLPQGAPADGASNPAGWGGYSSKLLTRLSSATQTPMPQMPGAVPTPETPRNKN